MTGSDTFPQAPCVIFYVDRFYGPLYESVVKAGRQRGWRVRLMQRQAMVPGTRCLGVIAAAATPSAREYLASLDCPVIHLIGGDDLPGVKVDQDAVGRLGARHFLELGYSHLGFVKAQGYRFGNSRRDGFAAAVRQAGLEAILLDAMEEHPDTLSPTARISWMQEKIAAMPRPLALMADDDLYATELVFAALGLGLRVPQDVAVLAPDNQPVDLLPSPLGLSAIEGADERLGRRAVELLAERLEGRQAPQPSLRVSPTGVVTRASTAHFVSELPGLSEAILYLRRHYRERIFLDDVASHSGLSVRNLQRLVKNALGLSVSEELMRLRVDHAARLLAETDLKISVIALESGFGERSSLHEAFRKLHQVSASEYRSSRRGTPCREDD
ncbi:MAG: hypothetical protein RL095_725 [Verrucomicrobiota bacterium]